MADEDPCSTNGRKLIDFPPLSLLDELIHSFPEEWRGVFASLNSEHLPVQAASFWLQRKSASEKLSDVSPNWKDFLDHLVRNYPVVLNDKLFFNPKILLLPLNIQSNTLAFIAFHSCSAPVESLDNFVHSLRKFAPEFKGWRLSYLKIIDSKVRHLKESGNGGSQDREQSNDKENSFLHTDLITEESKARFEDLLKKYKLAESSITFPWSSSALKSELGGSDNNNENMCEQHVPTFKSKNGRQDDIDMIDLTDTCAQDVDVQSDKTLQEIHTASSYASVDSDIEIIEVVKKPVKQVKLEPDQVVMEDLTEPLPPEHFIITDNEDDKEQLNMNTEDVPEHLIINSKDVPEHSITNNEEVLVHLIMNIEEAPEHLIMKTEDVPENLITGEEAAVQPNLCGALQLKIFALQNLLQSLEANELNLSSEFQVFCFCSSQEMECICTQLNLKDIKESVAILWCQQFVALSTDPSFSNAAIFAAHCVLPKVQGLKQTASRVLFSAVSQFAKKHSRAFCDGVIITLIHQSNLDTPQVDLINKVIKESLNEDTRMHLLQLIFTSTSNTDQHPFLWTESTVSILQTLVDLKPELNGHLFGTLIRMLEQQSRHLSKSLKFAKMLLAVIKTYGPQVSLHYNSFVHILERNETFLKKAGLSALKKTTAN